MTKPVYPYAARDWFVRGESAIRKSRKENEKRKERKKERRRRVVRLTADESISTQEARFCFAGTCAPGGFNNIGESRGKDLFLSREPSKNRKDLWRGYFRSGSRAEDLFV